MAEVIRLLAQQEAQAGWIKTIGEQFIAEQVRAGAAECQVIELKAQQEAQEREKEKPRMSDQHEKLLKAAVDDRTAHPWRYYKLEHADMKRMLDQLAERAEAAEARVAVLEDRLGRVLVTLGICYGQDEEAAVWALCSRLSERGEHPERIARDAVRDRPKWRLSDAEIVPTAPTR